MGIQRGLQFYINMDLRKFVGGLGDARRATASFVADVERKFAKQTAGMNNMIKGFAAPAAALLTAGTIYKAVNEAAKLDAALRRTSIDANMSTVQMLQYKNQILDLGIKSGTSTDNLLALGASALDSYKDFGKVTKNLEFMNTVMQASGAGAKEVGDYFGSLSDNAKMTDGEIEQLTARLYAFGKGTNREMKFSEIMGNVPGMIKQARGYLGKNADLKSIGDFVVTSMFTGSPTAVGTAMRMMSKNTKELKKLGFDLSKGLPSIAEVAKKISSVTTNEAAASNLRIKLLGRGAVELQKLWTEQKEYNEALKESGTLMDIYADGATISKSYAAGMNRLSTVFTKISDVALGPVINEIADSLSKMDPDTVNQLANNFSFLATSAINVSRNISNMITILDEGLDVLGRWNNIIKENEAQRKLIEEKGAQRKMIQTGVVAKSIAPSSSNNGPGYLPPTGGFAGGSTLEARQLFAEQTFSGGVSVPKKQTQAQGAALAEGIFSGSLGGVTTTVNITLDSDGKKLSEQTISRVGRQAQALDR